MPDAPPTVVVPVKRFADAKERLAPALSPDEREHLARRLAEGVTRAARDLDVVVCCDDPGVRDWAVALGHSIAWTPGRDLNGAVTDAVAELSAAGIELAVVAHADLAFPATLVDVARRARADDAVIVADRHGDGTNVLAVPTGAGWRFGYGAGSFRRHLAEAERLGLRLVVVDDDGARLGRRPSGGPRPSARARATDLGTVRRMTSPTLDLDVPARALAVAAHPDDVEFGCGATLAKWTAAGTEIVHVICTDGSKGTWDAGADIAALVARRTREQAAASVALGGTGVVEWLGRVDGELDDDRAAQARPGRADPASPARRRCSDTTRGSATASTPITAPPAS